ncbi:MAG: hypothetical protein M5U19_11640 [Microthrixaceae bacterium]|nr:hypothetical protein [Microthrixaceae bacterium]
MTLIDEPTFCTVDGVGRLRARSSTASESAGDHVVSASSPSTGRTHMRSRYSWRSA